jgi:hypothetical protein
MTWRWAIRRPWMRFGLLMMLCLVVSGCGLAAVTPTPGLMHEWSATPVLVTLQTQQGMFGARTRLPSLVIYADGTVIRMREESTAMGRRQFIDRAQLPPADLCRLLGQIDAAGFFEVNPADYVNPRVVDLGNTIISVDAWRSNAISAYALEIAVDEPRSGAVVPPGLAATYRLLATYTPPNFMPYQPERIDVDVAAIAATDVPAIVVTDVPTQTAQTAVAAWPVAGLVLADLVKQREPLDGPPAAAIYALFATDTAATRFYQADGQVYAVRVRPLLPFEQWPSRGSQGLTTFAMTPTVPLACPGR